MLKSPQEFLEEAGGNGQPPVIVILKRKTLRMFPDGTKVALYHSDKLGKDFIIAFDSKTSLASSEPMNGVFKEEFDADTIYESNSNDAYETLKYIHLNHAAKHIVHPDKRKTLVDATTADALLKVHAALKPENQEKMKHIMNKSKEHFHKVVDFAWKNIK